MCVFTARVMPTLPKQERPAREGARVASVETGLAAAAAKLAQQVSVKREHLRNRNTYTVSSVEENNHLLFGYDSGTAKTC